MLRFFLLFGVILVSSLNIYGQKSVNDYKYVVVPKKYDFLRNEDAYQLNSLTKFLFNKYGFNAYVQGEDVPEDLALNGCKALRADVKKGSGLFLTRLAVELSDCNGNVIFTSSEGNSKEKDYKKAYHESLREAFQDVQALRYSYNEKSENKKSPIATAKESPVEKEKQKKEVQEIQEKKEVSKAFTGEKIVSYQLNESNFIFESREYGFELFQKKEQKVSLGKIYKSSKDNVYIVKAGDFSGVGSFDGFGNFVLDRVNPVTNKLITDTFARQ